MEDFLNKDDFSIQIIKNFKITLAIFRGKNKIKKYLKMFFMFTHPTGESKNLLYVFYQKIVSTAILGIEIVIAIFLFYIYNLKSSLFEFYRCVLNLIYIIFI